MGNKNSAILGQLPDKFSASEHFFGFENFGNTCYVNAVVQALYFCAPFRQNVLAYYESKGLAAADKAGEPPRSLLHALATTFSQIARHKERTGVISPESLVRRIKVDNEAFRGFEHQDAQEFLNFLLNSISDQEEKEWKQDVQAKPALAEMAPFDSPRTFVKQIFEGVLVNEMKCICCETVTRREEKFLDLSLDVAGDCTIRECMRQFSHREVLDRSDKFFCNQCQVRQEAFKCLRIKQLPEVLVLHLKRFKYMENLQRLVKLSYQVDFPAELKIPETQYHPEKHYSLFAVVVHIGSGMRQGHYVVMVKIQNVWFLYDDDEISVISFDIVQKCYGSMHAKVHYDGYLLFYN